MIYPHNLDPYLLGPWTIGSVKEFGIRWYSLAYIIGFLWIYGVLYKAVTRRKIPNADIERLEEACLILILAIIAGGRLGYFLLNEPAKLATVQGWLEIPQVWHGGMAFFGAAVALFVTEYWYCRKNHCGFWHGADRLVWPLAFALGLGRIANFINGELWGVPTGGGWGVLFPHAELIDGLNVPRHPVQLYEAISHALLGGLLVWICRRRPTRPVHRMPGFVCCYFFIGYGLLRCLTDHWRPEAVNFGPLTGGQLLSLAFALAGFLCLRLRWAWFQKHATDLDWYPAEGLDGDLPDAAHAWIDQVNAERRTREAEAERRRTERRQRRK